MDIERLYNVEQLAELLVMTPDAVRKMAEREQVPCIRIGRRLRFRPSAINAWLAEKGRSSASRKADR